MVQQLQLMGEVVYLKAEAQDLVVLDPAWLTHQQIGHLLSTQYAAHARVTGKPGGQVMHWVVYKYLQNRVTLHYCQT